jgi:hypothetical protein
MRSGKSHFANELLKFYLSQNFCGIVYNLGRNTDFEAARHVFGLDIQEHLRLIPSKQQRTAYKENPFVYYYKDAKTGKIGKWKNLNLSPKNGGIAGQAIKMPRLEQRAERCFFDAFYQYAANTFLILDDMRGAFYPALKPEFYQLFSRINHAGVNSAYPLWKGKGATVAIILHSLDDINSDLFTYATHIVNFKYAFRPAIFSEIAGRNPILSEHLEKSFNFLNNAPQYTHTITDIDKATTQARHPDNPNYFFI